MIKILHTGDWHININATRLGKVSTAGQVRKERLNLLNSIISTAVEEKVDVVAIPGDVFDKSQPYPQDYDDLIKILDKVPSNIWIMMVHGNHDEFTTKGCGLQAIVGRRTNLSVYLEPNYVDDVGWNLSFVYGPWGTSIEELEENIEKAEYPAIVLLHGGVKSDSHKWVEIEGEEGNYHLSDLEALGAKAIMLSHFHGQKQLAPNIWYAGSPDNVHGFSEEKDTKGFLIWEIGEKVKVNSIPTNILLPEWQTLSPDEFMKTEALPNSYVRVKGEVDDKERLEVIRKLNDFNCIDYKLDLTSKVKKNRVYTLKGKNDQEVLKNYFKQKDIKNATELLKLDKEII